MKKVLSLMLALALCLGLAAPALADNPEIMPMMFSFTGEDYIEDKIESVAGFGEENYVQYVRAGCEVEVSYAPGFVGEVQSISLSAAGVQGAVYYFENNAERDTFHSVVISFTKGQTPDGKIVDLTDPSQVYVLTAQATGADGSGITQHEFFRVVKGTNGEATNYSQTLVANPLIVKSGLDYDSVIQREDGYYEVEKDGKHGLLDEAGNEIIPPIYTDIGDISDGMVRVGASVDGTQFGERKYGYVNAATGELAIPMEYDDQEISNFSNGYAVITHREEIRYRAPGDMFDTIDAKTKCGLVDKQGNMIIPLSDFYICPSRGTGELAYDFSDNRVVIEKDGKYIVMDTQGNILFEPQFDSVAGYENGFAIVTQNGKQGFIGTQGNVVVQPQYEYVWDFRNDGYARVGNNGLYGAVNRQGQLVVPVKYSEIGILSEGMFCVAVDDPDAPYGYRFGFVDTTGNLVIPTIYYGFSFFEMSQFQNDLAHVTLMDERFNEVNPRQTKHGYIDKQGNVVIPIEYSDADDFSNGLARVHKGTANGLGNPTLYGEQEKYDRVYAKFKELGIDIECLYIDTAGNVVQSVDPTTGTNRFYAERSADGTWAILRNPFYHEIATPNRSTVLVNGQAVAFDAYTINQNNYFKLRDLAKVLSGTGKQFEVTWDGNANAINMLSGKPYTAVGGELAQGDGMGKIAFANTATVYLDGQPVSLLAYTINQNNYFKLRDVGQAFDFDVTWDGARNTIVIDTTHSYTAD